MSETGDNAVQPQSDTPELDRSLDTFRKQVEANPSLLPPQFGGDVEKFVESYRQLHATHTRTSQELSALKAKVAPPKEEATVEPPEGDTDTLETLQIPDEPVPDDAPKGGVDWEAVKQEFVSQGGLTETTREAILGLGIPSDVLAAFEEGQRVRQQAALAQAHELVGGKDRLNQIVTWAQKNLDADTKATVNQGLQGPGWRTILMGLAAQMTAATAKNEPNRTPTVSSGPSTSDGPQFRSQRELSAAIRDPRYQTDPDYRDSVARRAANMSGLKIVSN